MTPNTYRVDVMEVGDICEIGIVCGTWRMPNVIRVVSVGFWDQLLGRTKDDLVVAAIARQEKKVAWLNWRDKAVEE